MFFFVIVALCGCLEVDIEEKIVGKWCASAENYQGKTFTWYWTFYSDGTARFSRYPSWETFHQDEGKYYLLGGKLEFHGYRIDTSFDISMPDENTMILDSGKYSLAAVPKGIVEYHRIS